MVSRAILILAACAVASVPTAAEFGPNFKPTCAHQLAIHCPGKDDQECNMCAMSKWWELFNVCVNPTIVGDTCNGMKFYLPDGMTETTLAPTITPTATPTANPTHAPTARPTESLADFSDACAQGLDVLCKYKTGQECVACAMGNFWHLFTQCPTPQVVGATCQKITEMHPTMESDEASGELLKPTGSPTKSPTQPPQHACDGGDHGCDVGNGGICVRARGGGTGWTCACKQEFACTSGCDFPWEAHECVKLTVVPTSAPTATPTPVPTTMTPTNAPTNPPTYAPTANPTQHACEGNDHGCDTNNGGVCYAARTRGGIVTAGFYCGCQEGFECVSGCFGAIDPHQCKATSSPTRKPTVAPTNPPTLAPTHPPTLHPCTDGSHGCDKGPGGACYPARGSEDGYFCACKEGYECAEGCWDPSAGHVCKETAAPTPHPTRTPTNIPTHAPTPFPTVHACDGNNHGCDVDNGGVCYKARGGGASWSCGCKAGYECVGGCNDPEEAHRCNFITPAPTKAPTAPTDSPTRAPTPSKCEGSHSCQNVPGGVCYATDNDGWTCGCKSGWTCNTNCNEAHNPHGCVQVLPDAPDIEWWEEDAVDTSVAFDSDTLLKPTVTPTASPTEVPTAIPTKGAPHMDYPPDTAAPTLSPTVVAVPCVVSLWAEWSPCTELCGGGIMHRARAIDRFAENGGTACPALGEIEDCNVHACPVHCKHSWTQWNACSETCGAGAQHRELIIEVKGSHGGNSCEGLPDMEERVCDNGACPTPAPTNSLAPTGAPTNEAHHCVPGDEIPLVWTDGELSLKSNVIYDEFSGPIKGTRMYMSMLARAKQGQLYGRMDLGRHGPWEISVQIENAHHHSTNNDDEQDQISVNFGLPEEEGDSLKLSRTVVPNTGSNSKTTNISFAMDTDVLVYHFDWHASSASMRTHQSVLNGVAKCTATAAPTAAPTIDIGGRKICSHVTCEIHQNGTHGTYTTVEHSASEQHGANHRCGNIVGRKGCWCVCSDDLDELHKDAGITHMISVRNKMQPHSNDAILRMKTMRQQLGLMNTLGSTQYVEGRIVTSMHSFGSAPATIGPNDEASEDLTGPLKLDDLGEVMAEENMMN